MIQEWGGDIVDTMEFPDHHRYSIKDWQEISRASRRAERIITTEKDIVKLIQFPFANGSILALRVKMVVERGDALIGAVERAIHAKRERVGPG
jgi:tetraacyldisaccharide-1-P 4'-kinase